MTSKINVLIPDGDSTWALSVIQCLSQFKHYKLFVLSNKKRTATKFSKYTSYYKFYKRPQDASWLDILNSEIESNAINVVVPIAELEASFFIKNKEKLSDKAQVIPLPALSDFEIAINKRKLSEFAEKHSIPHPKSFLIASESDKKRMLSQINFPILVKPLNQKGGDGIKKVGNVKKLPKALKIITTPQFVQEYIEGYDIDCSVLCLNGTILTYTIQKGNLKGDNAYAPQLGFDFMENDEVLNVVSHTMKKLNWSGVAHLDLRYDKQVKNYKLIEINARFWGSIDASRKAGVNFPDLVIKLALNGDIEKQQFEPISYMRLKGVLKSIKRRPLFLFNSKYLANNTEMESFLKDPFPTIYKFREWLGRQF
ncbi:ATP-grasp domain-containing protein [Psychroserpens sp. SPM9]|uniref:ATP-grasp domain-containing protein n=1 Tax=Psychroserpens sp. SPM9 TaxID=2975598 RepID=UPI0021A263F2|nr:ATP-grasp domain-containing protein [Psychroserpens sp. SPM9]MDG5492287.1 ATP-grasp domain-containing protein [Psychroserpens sp. SPM9]